MALSHLAIKLIAAALLFFVTIFVGVLPIKLIGYGTASARGLSPQRKFFLSLSNCFAGGVFFSTCILDLLPMVRDKVTAALKTVDIVTEFPLGEFFVSFGFLMMLILEQVVHSLASGSVLIDEHEHINNDDRSKGRLVEPPFHPHSHPDIDEEDEYASEDDSILGSGTVDKNGVHSGAIRPTFRRSKSLVSTRSRKSICSVETVTHSNFRTYVLIIALSLHSLFEGLAVGLITDLPMLFQILIALLVHKSILAFSLGVKLLDSNMTMTQMIKGVALFSSMAPIGVGVGLAVLTSVSKSGQLFSSGILQGIATGTFLYVTFFEVLPHELSINDHRKSLKILFIIIGYTAIAGVCYYEKRFHHAPEKTSNLPGPKT